MSSSTSLSELIEASGKRPPVFDTAVAAATYTHLTEQLPELGEGLAETLKDIASASPYLARLMVKYTSALADMLARAPDESWEDLLRQAEACGMADDQPTAAASLRQIKSQAALFLALMDLTGLWTGPQLMQGLSDFADAAVRAAFEFALRAQTSFPQTPLLPHSGIAVLAMGKHGAGELNYSSDIDLVVFYDPVQVEELIVRNEVPPRLADARSFMRRVVQTAVALLHEQTAEGYVFRTDLRLRPDPGASAIAVTLSAAERYYETYGQNWERAAYIKSRFIAGQESVGKALQDILTPFIWRKYLDYAAIEDIHAIKRQIHAVKGSAEFGFAGHDIKVGRGGIREIEFFVQTQQLILGGKNTALRGRRTLEMLQALAEAGQITKSAASELTKAYLYLRHIEHRIQMINDEQTHMIPRSEEDILRLARLSGYETSGALRNELTGHLKTVHEHYADLFHEDEPLSVTEGSLVFTGVEDDKETLETLKKMGFADAAYVSGTIRKWQAGEMRATRTARAREILTRLVPAILLALSHAADPDTAFRTFDTFLRRMPAGIQVFAMLEKNPGVIELITRLVDLSPLLAQEMAAHTPLVEALLDEGFLADMDGEGLTGLSERLAQTELLEDAMNQMRREAREARFAASCRLLLAPTGPQMAPPLFTQSAEAVLSAALPVARKAVVQAHGEIDGDLAVVGMGRLGAGNLTASSDLDLIFIYDVPLEAKSDGEKPLDGVTWYTRLVRRLVTVLSAQTEEGGLYEVDMALRPSGGAGPAAVSLTAFEKYYERDAWTWEEMALVKARVIAGGADLQEKLDTQIADILTRPRDVEKVRGDARDMRQRLLDQKPARSFWDLKLTRGGLTDIDFICQYLSLVHGVDHGRFPRHIAEALPVFVTHGLMAEDAAEALAAAARDYELFMQITRAALGGPLLALEGHTPLVNRLCTVLGVSGIAELEALIESHSVRVQSAFDQIIAMP